MKTKTMKNTSILCTILAAALLLLAPAAAKADPAPKEALGTVMYYTIQKGETLSGIAQRFGIGIGELRAANPRVVGAPKAGQVLTLPTAHLIPDVPREGIVLNLAERRLYYFRDPWTVMSFPVTIGKDGWETPTGVTRITEKRKDPTWVPTDNLRAEDPTLPEVVPPGPDNPLGKYALNLGWPGIRIHGTNNPSSIGRQVSHGCIRMYPADIEKLFNMVSVGTKVNVINTPVKAGWNGNTLLLEITPPNSGGIARAVTMADVRRIVEEKAAGATVDWDTVKTVMKRRDGLPAAIGSRHLLSWNTDFRFQ